MFEHAKAMYQSRLKVITNWDDVIPTLDNKCIAVSRSARRRHAKTTSRNGVDGLLSLRMNVPRLPVQNHSPFPSTKYRAGRWTIFGRSD
ncbi:hypothetical protein M0805_002876 [Coniferiporia weirii]|nr:hypothetical protein M0805_002876 [Coniferiporia weirii]